MRKLSEALEEFDVFPTEWYDLNDKGDGYVDDYSDEIDDKQWGVLENLQRVYEGIDQARHDLATSVLDYFFEGQPAMAYEAWMAVAPAVRNIRDIAADVVKFRYEVAMDVYLENVDEEGE